ncbi:O-antigen ligase family protein [Thermoanaerobacterium thermosaccharolyticum]|uniref:hypothetical protein n=1 Tax=Thermoanaerobacterium thermosaccharolyticum TaxID=1517 RepID=UPI003D285B98
MTITSIGLIIITITIFLFVLLQFEKLFYLSIFFIPFTATGVFLINRVNRITGISVFDYIVILCLLGMIVNIKRKFAINRIVYRLIIVYMLFLINLIISTLLMPLLINGNTEGYDQYGNLYPINLSLFNFTQLLYFLFSLIIIFVFLYYMDSESRLLKSIYIFIYSGVFVCIWGWYQLASNIIDNKYYINIFNNMNEGYKQVIYKNIPRLVSVTLEPSNISMIMIILICLVLFLRDDLISKKMKYIFLLIFFISTVLTFSTTSILGLILIILYIIYKNLRYLQKIKINFNRIFYVILIFVIMVSILANYYNVFQLITTNKLSTASGVERFNRMIYSLNLFLKYPIIGVGLGSNETYDGLSKLLSNSGIIGFLLFIYLIYLINKNISNVRNDKLRNVYTSLCVGNNIYFVVALFSGLNFTSPFLWCVWGFLFSILNIDKRISNLRHDSTID